MARVVVRDAEVRHRRPGIDRRRVLDPAHQALGVVGRSPATYIRPDIPARGGPTCPRAYVTNEISGTVTVVDTRSHAPVATVRLESPLAKPVGIAVSRDGGRVYVANGHGNSVSVIDAATNRVVSVVPVGRRPWGIAVSADGSRIYTANGGSDDVSVIDAATLRVLHTVPVGSRPWGVAIVSR